MSEQKISEGVGLSEGKAHVYAKGERTLGPANWQYLYTLTGFALTIEGSAISMFPGQWIIEAGGLRLIGIRHGGLVCPFWVAPRQANQNQTLDGRPASISW